MNILSEFCNRDALNFIGELVPFRYDPKSKELNRDMLFYISRSFSFILNKAEVRESPIHEKGVFATKNIKKDEVITFYPGHFGYFCSDGNKLGEKNVLMVKSPSILATENGLDDDNGINKKYCFELNEHYCIAGHPKLIDNPTYLGHMINDGAKSHSNINNYNSKDEELYYTESLNKRNCEAENIKDLFIIITATRDIEKDEELFMVYGYEYWISQNDV